MPAHPLGCGMDNDIRTEVDWSTPSPACTKSVIHYKGNIVLMRKISQVLKVRNATSWVPNGFDEDHLRLVVDVLFELFSCLALRPFDCDAESW